MKLLVDVGYVLSSMVILKVQVVVWHTFGALRHWILLYYSSFYWFQFLYIEILGFRLLHLSFSASVSFTCQLLNQHFKDLISLILSGMYITKCYFYEMHNYYLLAMHCWHFPCFFHFTSDIYIIHYTLLRYYSSLLIYLKGRVWIFSTPRLIETFLGWNPHEDENATWMLTVLHTNINMLIKNFYCFLLWFVSANTEVHVSETWLGDCTPSLANSFQGDSRLFNWFFFLI